MQLFTIAYVHLEFIRKTLLVLPGVTEKLCFDTPAFYVNKKYFARLKEDGETLVLQTLQRDKWITANPDAFFITDHYFNYDYMLINLKTVSPDDLTALLLTAWHNRATKKLIKEYEEGQNINNI
ncbi:MmcQ/YjbR family DNA-binding protein [Mucilaginibacter sp. OK098]|uniref:MmcQ/YjbR family DNA-binding protein n=1 Tax=Mucilaginibacter sp. OK098 TaxID=1855297 RepID=UPI0009242568|nr:MmcQ/YjbR family DNA-binding protein [Mucilaginibacter sp. OK098]SHM75199.1 hypothetical protein SAMN05216524_103283 [Mucilaginibacter sp. OK098]